MILNTYHTIVSRGFLGIMCIGVCVCVCACACVCAMCHSRYGPLKFWLLSNFQQNHIHSVYVILLEVA